MCLRTTHTRRNGAKPANQSLIIKVVCNPGSLKHAVACRRFQKVSLTTFLLAVTALAGQVSCALFAV